MTYLQVQDGRNTFQIWRAVVNVLDKQSQRADNRKSSHLGFGHMSENLHYKMFCATKLLNGSKSAMG
jgi:hypothetical protein